VQIKKRQKKINILYIIDTLCGEGGTENHLYYLVKHLNRNEFNCSIVSFNIWGSFVEKVRDTGARVYHVPVAKYYTPNALVSCYKIRKIIKDNMINIVQTFHYKSDTYGVITSRLSGVNHVISSRRDIGDTKKKIHLFMNNICNKFIERFITVCDAVGQRLISNENIPLSKQITIYNGVDIEKFTVPDKELIIKERKKLGIKEYDFVIGYVANFRPEKNHDIFFEAVKKVKDEIKGLKVVVVGDGPTEKDSKSYCSDYGMDEIVIFVGRAQDVSNYIAVMDVACLVPGSNEGFSNAILEKMAMGKPMIVTDVGGNAESVVNEENGIVIPPFDSNKLAEAIVYLYKNPSNREKMGRKSRERVERFFNIKDMIEHHEQFYKEVVSEKGEFKKGEAYSARSSYYKNSLSLYMKKIIIDIKSAGRMIVSAGLYYSGSIGMVRLLRNKTRKTYGIIILAYHDISEKDYLNLGVPPGVFRSHIQYLIDQGYNIISLKDAVNLLQRENNEPILENTIVITFDDVYKSFYKTVFPVVKEYGIPITIFICTEPIEKRIPPFVDALIYAFAKTSSEKIDLARIGLKAYRLSSHPLKENAINEINEYSKELSVIDRNNLLMMIFELLGLDFPSEELSEEILSWDEITEMSKNGLVDFGAHTMNHPSLSKVSKTEIIDEIWASKLLIEQKLQKEVSLFAYPYGSTNDINEAVRREVRNRGLLCGCSLLPGINFKGDDSYSLKRSCVFNQIKPDFLRFLSKAVFAFHMIKI
jgi:glycosyltransferase involved in cell wall biosynthesis/peptidoglycan/xylan/chitin deacetylase (PgdA/CDA1 family)